MASKSQPVGTPVDSRLSHEGRYAVEPSGPRGDNPATAGPGPTSVLSDTPENAEGQIQPSPEDTNTSAGSMTERSMTEK